MTAQPLYGPQRLRKTSRGVRTPSRRERGSQRRLGTEKRVKRFPVFGSDALPQRFWDKIEVVPETGCWRWMAYKNKHGYGQFAVEGRKTMPTHRVSFLAFRGWLPDWKRGKGLVLDHYLFPQKCIGPSCVHPYHVKAVTQRQNVLRSDVAPAAVAARRTSCAEGHEYTEETTVLYRDRNGRTYRKCKICNVEKMRAWKAANREHYRAYQREWARKKRAAR